MPLNESELLNLPRWKEGKKGFSESYLLPWHDSSKRSGFFYWGLTAPLRGEVSTSFQFCFANLLDPNRNRFLRKTSPLSHSRIEEEIFYFSSDGAAIFQTGSRGEIQEPFPLQWDLSWAEANPPRPVTSLLQIVSLPLFGVRMNTPQPSMKITGEIKIEGETVSLQNSPAAQFHRWGERFSNGWWWAHCNSFQEPEASFEALTVPIRIGKKPRLATFLHLSVESKRISFSSPLEIFRVSSFREQGHWHLEAANRQIRVVANLSVPDNQIHGVREPSPEGGNLFSYRTTAADLHLEIFKKDHGWHLWKQLTSSKGAVAEFAGNSPEPSLNFWT